MRLSFCWKKGFLLCVHRKDSNLIKQVYLLCYSGVKFYIFFNKLRNKFPQTYTGLFLKGVKACNLIIFPMQCSLQDSSSENSNTPKTAGIKTPLSLFKIS